MGVLLEQVSARPLADATVDVPGISAWPPWGLGCWSLEPEGLAREARPSSGPAPRCGTIAAGRAPLPSRSIVTTVDNSGLWSRHTAFTTTHDLCRLKPAFTGQDRTPEAGQPHATRTLLTQSLAAHGLRPDPLPGQRRASDLTRCRSAHGLLFPAGPGTALPRPRGSLPGRRLFSSLQSASCC